MSASIRLILSPKCSSPLSPLNKHLGRSLKTEGTHDLKVRTNLEKKSEFLTSPSQLPFTKLNLHNFQYNSDKNNNNNYHNELQLVVPDIRKCEHNAIRHNLMINTPQKIKILKDGLSEKNGLNILGRGTFGTVVRGFYKDQNVAVKVIKYDVKKNKKLRESNILNLCHENIVRTLDIVVNQNQNHAIVIMEYVENSRQLQCILDDKTFKLEVVKVAEFSLDICKGLSFCHHNDILHLDIKPSNILVCENDRCKLCDFGNCFKVNAEEKAEPYIHQGTVAYTAPEILLGKEPTVKADIYSFGILLWQMVYREIPYYNIDRSEIIIYKVVKFGLRPKYLAEAKQDNFRILYQQCWRTFPEDRPDTETVIKLLSLI